MSRPAETAALLLWRFRLPLGIVVLLLWAAAAWQTAGYSVSNTLESWYPRDDPMLVEYRSFQQEFGSDEIVVVAVDAPDGLQFDSVEGLELVAMLTDWFIDIEGVANVTSLVTVPESLASARGRLMSGDRRTTALVVQTMLGQAFEARRALVFADIRGAVEEFGLTARLGGYGVVFEALNEASTTGAATLIALAHAVMIGLLWFFYRQVLPVVATVLSVTIAATWTMGLYFATGHSLNMVTMVLPTLVLVIGTADCMHILRGMAAGGGSRRERTVAGLADVMPPCLVTTVTTAAGFLGLTVTSLPVVAELGWFGATGVVFAYLSAVIVVPAVCAFGDIGTGRYRRRGDRAARRLFDLAVARPLPVVGAFAAIGVLAAAGMSRLTADTDSISYLDRAHPVRQDSDYIEARIGPYVPVEFIVTADGPLWTATRLDAIWRWQREALASSAAGWSWSILDALGAGDEPPSAQGLAALTSRLERLRSFSPATARAMLTEDGRLRVAFGAPLMSAKSVQALIETISARADLPAGVEIRPAGYAPLYTRIVDEIVTSQVRGFGFALVLVVAILGLSMRSWRRMLLALPANGIPIAVALGLMGATGIPLDVASATIASVMLGLVVDDTVHLLRPDGSPGLTAAMAVACDRSGGTLLATTMVLAGGFLVLGLAEIRSIAWFGVLTATAVGVAIATDLLLLPALARLFERGSGSRRSFINN